MKKKNNFQYEKLIIEKKLNLLKQVRLDPNNIVLNAAAFQDQMLIDMGLKKKINNTSFKPKKEKKTIPKVNLLEDVLSKGKESEKEVINRNRQFLNKLTFAEKTGVKKIKAFPLSLGHWKQLEEISQKRDDFKGSCPICLDLLCARDSIILSCSHVFHKVCIRNFERFTSVTKCPICRYENYESKNYYKDKEYYVHKCVRAIQRFYKGYRLRYKLYKTIFSENMPRNKHLRSIYSIWKIRELTNKMCQAVEKKNKETQVIIQEIQKEASEISKIENKIKVQLRANNAVRNDSTDWNAVMEKMIERNNEICAICFCVFGSKSLILLDCTHCFHKNCIESFEQFDHYYEKRCPICRRNYTKKEIR